MSSEAEPASAEPFQGKMRDPRGPQTHGVHSQARRDERGAKRSAGGARLRGLWAMARTAAVVRQEGLAAGGEHRGALRPRKGVEERLLGQPRDESRRR